MFNIYSSSTTAPSHNEMLPTTRTAEREGISYGDRGVTNITDPSPVCASRERKTSREGFTE